MTSAYKIKEIFGIIGDHVILQLTGIIIITNYLVCTQKILKLYSKSHLWAIGFTTMVWPYRNYHKQCGKSSNNLVFWHDECIYKIHGSFEIKGNYVDALDHMTKLPNEHKGIRVRPAHVNSFIQSAIAILCQTHIQAT